MAPQRPANTVCKSISISISTSGPLFVFDKRDRHWTFYVSPPTSGDHFVGEQVAPEVLPPEHFAFANRVSPKHLPARTLGPEAAPCIAAA
jgi:hypothetical protein